MINVSIAACDPSNVMFVSATVKFGDIFSIICNDVCGSVGIKRTLPDLVMVHAGTTVLVWRLCCAIILGGLW